MAGTKSEAQKRARALFFQKKGDITPREIAEKVGASPEMVRKWKYRGKWAEELKKPKPGAPAGNKNAAGHGAPEGNTNAEKHGAYSRPRVELLSDDEREEIEGLQESFYGNALRELKRLEVKRADLERRIGQLQEDGEEETADLLDGKMVMELPDGGTMVYTNTSSAFSRRMKLEGELNRVDGRIIKLLDSIRGQENERRRIELEEKRLVFQQQKAAGIFNYDENGQLIPEEDMGEEVVEE
jgi:hypothetical protein